MTGRCLKLVRGIVAAALISCAGLLFQPVAIHAAPAQEYDSILLYDGYRLYQDGQSEKAIAVFKDLLEKYPNSKLGDLALLWTAKSYIKLQKPAEAKQALLTLQQKYPQSRLLTEANQQLAQLGGEAAAPAQAPIEAPKDTAAAEKVAAEKAAAEKAAAEKAAAEKVAAEKVAAERAADEK
ncbi:MAG: tetratricopeptide repeat protein, partial [Nitrospirota bacterium]|nr:tetratricopeptide repeat protein [Nitrospirota bacterium]